MGTTMTALYPAIYTEVEPATDKHGTQVVARMGHMRAAVPYPYELSEWIDIHATAVQELLSRKAEKESQWTPALFGAGVIWVCCSAEPSVTFKV